MPDVEVKTGFGYLKDAQGNITDKCELKPGRHQIKAGYTYVEVENRGALNAVQVNQPPEDHERAKEKKIVAEMRRLAIESLKARGEL